MSIEASITRSAADVSPADEARAKTRSVQEKRIAAVAAEEAEKVNTLAKEIDAKVPSLDFVLRLVREESAKGNNSVFVPLTISGSTFGMSSTNVSRYWEGAIKVAPGYQALMKEIKAAGFSIYYHSSPTKRASSESKSTGGFVVSW